MSKEIESYKLGKVQVVISETDNDNKLLVDCNDGTYHSEFTVRRYEYENYKRHMNQKITLAYNKEHEKENSDS
jgi:chemotaxis methyl-accepting protein methylase